MSTRRLIVRGVLAAVASVIGTGLLLSALVGCATTQLHGCTIQVSRSDPARDALVCTDHDPIALRNIDPALRAKLLEVGK